MNKYAILTDSTSNVKNGTIYNGIKVYTLPLYVYVNDVEYKENETITIEDIAKYLEEGTNFRSSQPSTMDFLNIYKEMLEDGVTHCIALHCSSGISGTFQNSVLSGKLNEESTGIKSFAFDSHAGAYPLEKMIKNTIDYLNQTNEKSWDCLLNDLEPILIKMREESFLAVIPSNLKQMVKSGRANTSQLIATTLLNIKIVLEFDENGKLQLKEKIRSDKRVKKYIESKIEEAIALNKKEFTVMYTNNKNECELLIEEFKTKYTSIEFNVKQMIPVVAIYAGNGTIAVTH